VGYIVNVRIGEEFDDALDDSPALRCEHIILAWMLLLPSCTGAVGKRRYVAGNG